jgi:hypothetical protein
LVERARKFQKGKKFYKYLAAESEKTVDGQVEAMMVQASH